ncbi:MAG TPA: MBL fold metallo-hydrolase [Chitinophagaceae bacterium]|nr:MBL fold metallo-hydrolase [Chitinophagaceae bacterium]
MESVRQIDAATLRTWLESKKEISVLDIRPSEERKEWYIPGSFHIDALGKLKEGDPDALRDVVLDKNVPVVTVCGGGKTSLIAADILRKQGYEAYSLQDGMKGWSMAWNTAVASFDGYDIIQLRRTGKGCLSYIAASDNKAVVIDASLPVELYKNILQERNWKLTAVMETHIHADHLSRSRHLSDQLEVPLLLPVGNKVSFTHNKIVDGQIIDLGKMAIRVIATPGHTIESVSYMLNNEVLFTGDTLFTNAVGRPDLKANEDEARRRAGLLYDSLQKLVQLNDDVVVFPAHTNTPINFDGQPVKATLSEIKKSVAVLKLDKNDFINTILDKLPPAPANHLTIVESNLIGNISNVNAIDLEAGANRCAVS